MAAMMLPRLRVFPEGSPGPGAAWQQVPSYKLASDLLAFVRCPRGHWGTLRAKSSANPRGHEIMADGRVLPSVVCPACSTSLGCDFHEWIQLGDWTPGRPFPMQPGAVRAVIVHDSEGPGLQPFGDVEDFHRRPVKMADPKAKPGRGWPAVAYHWLADATGKTFAMLPEQFQGTHCPGWNSRSVALCLLGDFDLAPPITPQLEAGAGILRDLLARYPGARVLGHRAAMIEAGRDPGKRACPGGGGRWLVDLEARARGLDPDDRLYQGGP